MPLRMTEDEPRRVDPALIKKGVRDQAPREGFSRVLRGSRDATGRRTAGAFAAACPEVEDEVWWKSDFGRCDPDQHEQLLQRTIDEEAGKIVEVM